jgi:hypothetical protein
MVENIKNPNAPDLNALLEEHKRDVQKSINCVQVGEIKSFDPARQKATVQIVIKQVISVDSFGNKTYTDYPLLIDCPVMVLFGGVDFMSMPIVSGDNCIVVFADREIDNWFVNGGNQPPTTSRVHDLSDGIAIVGIRPLTNSIATYLANGIRLSHGGGSSRMDFTDALITSVAALFYHHGDMRISEDLRVDGNFTVIGDTYGNGGGDWTLRANLQQESGKSIHAGNGANGTFTIVTVVDGIVISGS